MVRINKMWFKPNYTGIYLPMTVNERIAEAFGDYHMVEVGCTFNEHLKQTIFFDGLDESNITTEVLEWYNNCDDEIAVPLKKKWHCYYPKHIKEMTEVNPDLVFVDSTTYQEITNPFYDSTGRFEVDPVDEYGRDFINSNWKVFCMAGYHIAYTKKGKLWHSQFYGTFEELEEYLTENLMTLKGFDTI